MNTTLWKQFEQWQKECKWVDLSHPLSPSTPHWAGWHPLSVTELCNLNSSLFCAHDYTTVGQYGTHVDAPNHMVKGGRSLDQIAVDEMVYPLCVIDRSDVVATNADYSLTVADILDWEKRYGAIPEGAFVVFRSGWSKRAPESMDNLDDDGKRHFPGWSLDSIKFLVEERKIGGIGHETSDTEAPILSEKSNYEVEYYILAQNRIQLELLANVEQCPPIGALIFCTFPKVVGGTGYPARVFALCPR
ncbi:MAG: cyclase family protein [Deferribacteraceae bacterium]|jgi:kynurenine formamidase|nr:cyclase family protein [Deferribacteraceae bacterium]